MLQLGKIGGTVRGTLVVNSNDEASSVLTHKPEGAVVTSCFSLQEAEEIRAQLERVLNSQQFRSSRRCQILLRHVTEQTLAGDTVALKERTLGINVFGRPADYDTSQDPVVRATAAEIRKKLAQYYQEPAHEAETRIELVSGSYIPEFHVDRESSASAPRRRWRHAVKTGIGGVVLLAAIVFALLWPAWHRSDVELFW